MRVLALLGFLLASGSPLAGAQPTPLSVAILYNSAVPESRQLAEQYRQSRKIPAENLLAVEMPQAADISRVDYETSIAKPLRAEFDRRGWWKRERDVSGVIAPVSNRIRVLVTMRGVPLRIQPTPKPTTPAKPAAVAPATPPTTIPPQLVGHDEASVDSELAVLGVEGMPLEGYLPNRFYQSGKPLALNQLPFFMLTARIDAPTHATCERMIRDAVEAEQTGLWGLAYVDIANKFPLGDQWLESVVKDNMKAGIPTVVDRFNDTFPPHYPMGDAALYYGWYNENVSGPFLNPRFKFRKGAVAMHLHSYSAAQLTNPAKNWSGPLLEKGAVATIGNVYEPYLHLTHDFGILHQRLLAGDCWAEACWKAMPVTSWQAVVLGDPLYQPFKHLDGSGVVQTADRDFRAVRAATLRWPTDATERVKQLDAATQRTGSGQLAEAVALDLLQRGRLLDAASHFRTAKQLDVRTEDKMRQDFHLIAIDRAANHKDLAVRALREALTRYGPIPEAAALHGWLDILEPPPPPPAESTKMPAAKTPAPKAPAAPAANPR